MNRLSRWVGGAALVALGAMPLGCGSGAPRAESSQTEAKVHGSVKARGKAVTEGEVTFNPANAARKDAAPRSAPIKADGTYEITTLVGHNSVGITGPAVTKDPELAYGGLTYEVKSGDNQFDIELPPK